MKTRRSSQGKEFFFDHALLPVLSVGLFFQSILSINGLERLVMLLCAMTGIMSWHRRKHNWHWPGLDMKKLLLVPIWLPVALWWSSHLTLGPFAHVDEPLRRVPYPPAEAWARAQALFLMCFLLMTHR